MIPLSLRLLLTRHGQTADNVDGRLTGWGDTPLTPFGRLQAAKLAEHLAANYRLDGIYASPLSRALETARVVGERLGLVPVTVESLKEIHFGDCEGLTEAEFRERFPLVAEAAMVAEDLDFTWPGGECREAFRERVGLAMSEITSLNSGRTVLVVGHGGVWAYYLAEAAEGAPDRWRDYLMDNCGLSELVLGSGEARVIRHNYTAHLPNGPRLVIR